VGEPVLTRELALCIGELDGWVALAERLEQRLRLVLEMIEVGTCGQGTGLHVSLLS
jgi:hypothetical protein